MRCINKLKKLKTKPPASHKVETPKERLCFQEENNYTITLFVPSDNLVPVFSAIFAQQNVFFFSNGGKGTGALNQYYFGTCIAISVITVFQKIRWEVDLQTQI